MENGELFSAAQIFVLTEVITFFRNGMDPRHGGGGGGGGLARGGLSEPVLSLPKGYFLSPGERKKVGVTMRQMP